MAANNFKVALIQLATQPTREATVARAVSMVTQAASKGAQLVVLPEYFTFSPTQIDEIPKNSEPIPGPTTQTLANAAKDNGVFLIGGTIPEESSIEGKVYNSCPIFDPEGNMIGLQRKIHQYDVHVPGKGEIRESDVALAGDSLTCFDTPYCKVGVAVCYDLRFAELAQLYAQRGCKLLVYPSATVKKTAEAHWDLLLRARALDNQLYVTCACPARDVTVPIVLLGESCAVSPWGEVISKAGTEEEIVFAEIDLDQVTEVRNKIPLSRQKRPDMYSVVDKTETISTN